MLLNYILYNYYFMFCEFYLNGRKKENLPVGGDPAEARWGSGGWKLRGMGGWRSHGTDHDSERWRSTVVLEDNVKMQNNSLPVVSNNKHWKVWMVGKRSS